MNYVAAMLLLCLDLSEERAFWVMVALIDDNGQSLSSHCVVRQASLCVAAVAIVISLHCVASQLRHTAQLSYDSSPMLRGC